MRGAGNRDWCPEMSIARCDLQGAEMVGRVVAKKKLNEAGEFVEVPEYFLDGKLVSEEEFRAANPERPGLPMVVNGSAIWPKNGQLLNGLGVLPHQVEARREFDRKRGVPTDYVLSADGYAARPVYTSRSHRKKHLKAHGVIDRQGGYGD